MHYWRKDAFTSLKSIAEEAHKKGYTTYSSYCLLREKGVRKASLRALEVHIKEMEASPFEDRLQFTLWLLRKIDDAPNGQIALPRPLHERLVKPVVEEWMERDGGNAEAHYWTQTEEGYRKAIAVDPDFYEARIKLVDLLMRRMAYETHEFPIGYVGDPEEGLRTLAELEKILEGIHDSSKKELYMQEVEGYDEVIRNYLEYLKYYRETGQRGFEQWARKHQKRCQ